MVCESVPTAPPHLAIALLIPVPRLENRVCYARSMSFPTPESASEISCLLTKRALASFLGVTPRTVEIYQRQGLPFYRLGPRRNRYDLAAVRSWLERRCRVERIR